MINTKKEKEGAMNASYSHSQTYTLNPGKCLVTITLHSEGASFSGSHTKKTLNYGEVGVENPDKNFTVYSTGEYVYALIETQYTTVKGPPEIHPPSYCHIYFKPGGSNWLWSTDVQTADNPSIFPDGQGERSGSTITIQSPTSQNPSSDPSDLPNLNSELVFLLDINASGNMLFRGNEPLKPGTSNQDIDFQMLHNCLKSKYQIQTGSFDFPDIGEYVLRDIAFLDHDPDGELQILMAEIGSFGATKASQVDQQWYPATPGTFQSGMKGQVANWNVEPGEASTALDVEMVEKLSTWMSTPFTDSNGKVMPVVYYIHCSSGHDRTGMISSGYLMKRYGLGLSEAFILGTTIHKLNLGYGGNLVQDCQDIFTNSTDPDRSRCFVAGTASNPTYNNAIVNIYESLNNVQSAELSSKAVSGDPAIGNTGPAYVYPNYPWNLPAIATGYAAMEGGVVLEIGILTGGRGYTKAPEVTIEAPSNGGIQATAVAEITNGIVTKVTMTNQGSGYDFSPQVTFSSPD